MTEIKMGGLEVKSPTQSVRTIRMLTWGSSGCGKTVLASTFPGNKLWLQFDPAGTDSIADEDDFKLVDFSGEPSRIVSEFRVEECGGLGTLLKKDGESFDTIVVDSVTEFSLKALQYCIHHLNIKGATLERPSLQGYAARNAITLEMVRNILRLAGQYGKHVCFIAHEDSPVMNDQGDVLHITMSLGGKLSDQVPIQLSEVWFMIENKGKRKILVRPGRQRKPMKTRMFKADGSDIEFEWTYNQSTGKGTRVDNFYKEWKDGAYGKLPLPK